MEIKRLDIFYADIGVGRESEQSGIRPVIIIQNDIGNEYSPTTIIAPITSKLTKNPLPIHIYINKEDCGLQENSIILMEQIKTVDKKFFKKKIGTITSEKIIKEINNSLKISLSLN